jgi:cell division septation protein DedD
MEEVKIFNIRATVEEVRDATLGEAGEGLRGPLGAVAADIATRAAAAPLSVYICSDDKDRDIRNHFAFALAKSIRERLPNTLVIDCDFLAVGLSNTVPKAQGLGFLDLILYGSSPTIITQRLDNGTSVIGAGSFPVSKRTPFVMDAFEDTARYLVGHAGCVIFCGPAVDDDGAAHPIAGYVDLPVVVGVVSEDQGNVLRPPEEKTASATGSLVWGVRFFEPVTPTPVAVSSAMKEDVIELRYGVDVDEILGERPSDHSPPGDAPVGARDEEPADIEITQESGVPFEEEGPEESLMGRSSNSAFPKIVTSVLAIFLGGFLLWWLYLTKSIRDDTDQPARVVESIVGQGEERGALVTDPSEATADEPVDGGAPAESLAAARGLPRQIASEGGDQPASDRTTTPVGSEQTAAPTETDRTTTSVGTTPGERGSVAVPEELRDYAGRYLLHVSSFRGIQRARNDADYLSGRGYDIVIAQVDLGSKGLWYRVYVGPFATEREAETTKIKLDEIPRVRSTRITRVPGTAP